MAKREPRWVAVFLKQLERCGNVRMAAEGAGVDYTTAYQRRKRHGAFAQAWEAALRGHALRQARDERETPSPGSPAASPSSPPRGEEIIRPDGKLIRASAARWGKRAEAAFLLELTMSASVKLAAKAAGFSTTAVYKRRLKDRRFAAAWEAALETGKARVQAYLVEAATRTFDPDELPIADEREIPKVSIGEAINIAKLGPPTGSGRAEKGSWDESDGEFVTNEEFEEARQRIFERLQRIRETIAEQEQETGCCHNCGQPLPGEAGASQFRGPAARYLLFDAG